MSSDEVRRVKKSDATILNSPVADSMARLTQGVMAAMTTEPTGHLPECFATRPTGQRTPSVCICDRLRACEERVTSDFAKYLRHMEEWSAGYTKGYAAALDAARDAVTNARMHDVRDGLVAAAAIDALRATP